MTLHSPLFALQANRYDSRTTTFSPEGAACGAGRATDHAERNATHTPVHCPLPRTGHLYQVEYAITAIQNAAAAVGILTEQGIVIAGQKKTGSKLLAPPKTSEKLYKLDTHVAAAVAGLTSDADILVDYARLTAQRYRYRYDEPMPVEQLVKTLCNQKHSYTQFGGLRPFGVSFLFAGWDQYLGFQLYQSNPSGNYSGWKATAIGANSTSSQSTLKTDYKADMTLAEAQGLAVKVLTKAMDTTAPSSEQVEVSTVFLHEGQVVQKVLSAEETDVLIKEATEAAAEEGEEAK